MALKTTTALYALFYDQYIQNMLWAYLAIASHVHLSTWHDQDFALLPLATSAT